MEDRFSVLDQLQKNSAAFEAKVDEKLELLQDQLCTFKKSIVDVARSASERAEVKLMAQLDFLATQHRTLKDSVVKVEKLSIEYKDLLFVVKRKGLFEPCLWRA